MSAKPKHEDKWFTEAMVTWLGSDNVCGLEHGELENTLLLNQDFL